MRDRGRTARQHPHWRVIDTKVVNPGSRHKYILRSNHTRSGRSPRAHIWSSTATDRVVFSAHATKFHSRPGPAWPCGPHLDRPGRAQGRHGWPCRPADTAASRGERTELCRHRYQVVGIHGSLVVSPQEQQRAIGFGRPSDSDQSRYCSTTPRLASRIPCSLFGI